MSCENNSEHLSAIQINFIIAMLKARGYVIFTRPYELNIIGVRNTDTNPVKFDDTMYVFWKNDSNRWEGKKYVITTDPSTRYLTRPINTLGAAILPNGQYIDAWKIRKHRGKYDALGQHRSICVYRDYDRESTLTFNVESQSCGLYGINIHKAKSGGADDGQGNTLEIGPYSAGCQVFQNSYCFEEFMNMVYRQRDLYGNNFTYTLIDRSLERKFRLKRLLYFTMVASSLGLIAYGVKLGNR